VAGNTAVYFWHKNAVVTMAVSDISSCLRVLFPLLPLFVFICAGQLSNNYSISTQRLLLHSAWRMKALCVACGLPGAMSTVIHTGWVCCLCILYQQSICMLSPTVHSALCMDSNSWSVFYKVMSLKRSRCSWRLQLCVSRQLCVSSIYKS